MRNFLEKITFYNFCVLLLILSSFILFTNKVIIVYKDKTEEIIIDEIVHNNTDIRKNSSDYIAVLEIPKIGLKKGLVPLNSKNNSVEENVQVLSSDISNIERKTIILAAHSGSGYKAFFKDLDKLELGNGAYIYYNNKKFNYIVSDIYIEKKDGNIEVPTSNNLLVLTTCYGKDKQLVVMLEKDYDFVS